MNPKTLVIGLGNTLRGDDALGRIAAERVRLAARPHDVKVIDRCSPTPELAMELSEVSRVVFLDASVDGPTDQVVTRRLNECKVSESLGHRLDIGTLLNLSRQLYGHAPEAFAITFRGRTFEFSDRRLTPEAEAAVEQIVEKTLRLVGCRISDGQDYSSAGTR